MPADLSQVSDEMLLKLAKARGIKTAEGKGASDFLTRTLPQSALQFAKNVVTPIAHPIETAKGIGNLIGMGIRSKYGGTTPQDIQSMGRMGGALMNRYGGLSNIANTAYEDPVGMLADVSMIAGGVGLGLKAGGLTKAANVAGNVSNVTNPLTIASAPFKYIGKPALQYAVGKTTGGGYPAAGEALKGGPAFRRTFFGTAPEQDLVQRGNAALDAMKAARGKAYRAGLQSLKNSSKSIGLDDLQGMMDDFLKENNVGVANGKLNFDFPSTISGQAAADVQAIYSDLQDASRLASQSGGKLTPIIMDALKRRISDRYYPDRTSSALATRMSQDIKRKIVSEVPEYAEMTRGYEKMSAQIKDIQKALGVGQKSQTDLALRKMMTAMREDKTARRAMISTLENAAAEDLTGAIGGLIMKPVATNRLTANLTELGLLGLAYAAGNPALVAALLAASPKVAGTFLFSLGKIAQGTTKLKGPALVSFQAERLRQLQEQQSGK